MGTRGRGIIARRFGWVTHGSWGRQRLEVYWCFCNLMVAKRQHDAAVRRGSNVAAPREVPVLAAKGFSFLPPDASFSTAVFFHGQLVPGIRGTASRRGFRTRGTGPRDRNAPEILLRRCRDLRSGAPANGPVLLGPHGGRCRATALSNASRSAGCVPR